jgi:hypothetical protein
MLKTRKIYLMYWEIQKRQLKRLSFFSESNIRMNVCFNSFIKTGINKLSKYQTKLRMLEKFLHRALKCCEVLPKISKTSPLTYVSAYCITLCKCATCCTYLSHVNDSVIFKLIPIRSLNEIKDSSHDDGS